MSSDPNSVCCIILPTASKETMLLTILLSSVWHLLLPSYVHPVSANSKSWCRSEDGCHHGLIPNPIPGLFILDVWCASTCVGCFAVAKGSLRTLALRGLSLESTWQLIPWIWTAGSLASWSNETYLMPFWFHTLISLTIFEWQGTYLRLFSRRLSSPYFIIRLNAVCLPAPLLSSVLTLASLDSQWHDVLRAWQVVDKRKLLSAHGSRYI